MFFVNLNIPQQQKEKINGIVTEALPDTNFRVKLENDKEILAYLAGKMRLHYIRLMEGDKVRVEMSPKYDLDKGRITFRIRQ